MLGRGTAGLVLASILALALAGVFLVCKKVPVGSPPETPSTPTGNTNGGYHTSYEYTSMAVDPDSDSVAIRFDWGDGETSEWSAWVASGEAITKSHAWTDPGLYDVKSQAKDQPGSSSDWSEALVVTITTNLPPNTPATPSGPSSGCKDSIYGFTTITTDPDEDGVCYRFTWGTGDTSEWSEWLQSGQPGGASNLWRRAGAYVVKAQAKDSKDATSAWSNPHLITIPNPNSPATPAAPSGPTHGKPDTVYEYYCSAHDPDGDSTSLRFDWGNGDTSDWSDLDATGKTVSRRHAWQGGGTYLVRAQARDEDGVVSSWSEALGVEIGNRAPDVPNVSGPAVGRRSQVYSFRWYAMDPDGDSVACRFDWGNGDTSIWSAYLPSGMEGTVEYAWPDSGLYMVKAQTRDIEGALSAWSAAHEMDTRNHPPNAPLAPEGPSEGTCGESYDFSSTTSDPNGDSIALRFSWGDGDTSSWLGPVPSGRSVTVAKTWHAPGSFRVRAQAKDPDGAVSIWSDSVVISIAPDLKWRYNTGSSNLSPPALAPDGTAYFGCNDFYVYAIDAAGALRWRYRTTSAVYLAPAVAADGTVYVGSGGNLTAINSNGSHKWSYNIALIRVTSSPAIGTDGAIYVGTNDYALRAVNPNGTLRWRREFDGDVSSAPAIAADGTIYVGSGDSYLYAVNPGGSLRWSYQTGGAVSSSPAVSADGTVYVGSDDGYLYAVTPEGALRWRIMVHARDVASPVVGEDGMIYMGSTLDGLYAVNPEGTLAWQFLTGGSVLTTPAVAADGTVLFGTDFGDLCAVDTDGLLRWRFRTTGQNISPPAIGSDGTAYFGSDDRHLYAVKGTSPLADTPWPKFHRDNQNTGRAGGH